MFGLHKPKGPADCMKAVAITQRVSVVADYGERRDCLDQDWTRFLEACGVLPVVMPNVLGVALALCERADVSGVVLTGGNDLDALGGDAPERDAVETPCSIGRSGHTDAGDGGVPRHAADSRTFRHSVSPCGRPRGEVSRDQRSRRAKSGE